MASFTHKTTEYEDHPAYIAFKTFLDSYLIERNYEKTLSYLEEEFYSFGTGGDEVASCKEEFSKLLSVELGVVTDSIKYTITYIHAKEVVDNVWNILAGMEVMIPNRKQAKIVYVTRFTGCFRLSENGFSVVSMHISEPSGITEENEFLPFKYIDENQLTDTTQMNQIIFDIMSQSMPGGIISGFAEEGFPLYFVNDKYLELLGYSSYAEYYDAANGLGISHIHPDDVDMVNDETMHSYSTDTQYGIEYRLRHKDGHYIHVYDIGKKMVLPDNKEIIICVIYDMTEDAKIKERLIKEASHDALTGLYNRGGGIRTIERALEQNCAYSFAFFDIDNLKQLNDIYTHTAGDRALKKLAELLKRYLDDKTVITRIGGDEFVAFFKNRLESQRIESTFSELVQEYHGFIEQNYPESHSSVSVGCVTATRKRSFDELYQMTDRLMYDIKNTGKNGCKIIELD